MTSHDSPSAVLRTVAVMALTQAARQRDADGNPADFADFAGFLAGVLAAAAANVSGPDQLLASRPGSWEADHVHDLVCGTMGDEPRDWIAWRTEPVIVPLNVAELVDDPLRHPGLLTLGGVFDRIDDHHDHLPDDTYDPADKQREFLAAVTRYTDAYADYARRFTDAVHAIADELDLPVDVQVDADIDPLADSYHPGGIHNPDCSGGDPLAAQLWELAHDTVALPDIYLRTGVSA